MDSISDPEDKEKELEHILKENEKFKRIYEKKIQHICDIKIHNYMHKRRISGKIKMEDSTGRMYIVKADYIYI